MYIKSFISNKKNCTKIKTPNNTQVKPSSIYYCIALPYLVQIQMEGELQLFNERWIYLSRCNSLNGVFVCSVGSNSFMLIFTYNEKGIKLIYKETSIIFILKCPLIICALNIKINIFRNKSIFKYEKRKL